MIIQPGLDERGADGKVAWAIQFADGSISALGWLPVPVYSEAQQLCTLREDAKIVYAYSAPPLVVDDAMVERAMVAFSAIDPQAIADHGTRAVTRSMAAMRAALQAAIGNAP